MSNKAKISNLREFVNRQNSTSNRRTKCVLPMKTKLLKVLVMLTWLSTLAQSQPVNLLNLGFTLTVDGIAKVGQYLNDSKINTYWTSPTPMALNQELRIQLNAPQNVGSVLIVEQDQVQIVDIHAID